MKAEFKKSKVTGTINFKVGDRLADVFSMDIFDEYGREPDNIDQHCDSTITAIEYNSHGVTLEFESEV